MNQTMSAAAEQKPAFRNGHHEHKGYGNTIYRGELKNLPYPVSPVDTEAAIQAMYTDGYVLFPGALTRDEAFALRATMDSMGGDDAQYFFKDWCFNKHLATDFHKNANLLQYMDKPGIIDVADAIHGGCHVSGGSLWITGKGREMGIHIDYLPISLPEDVIADPRVILPIFSSTVHFYLNDMVAELGPTTVVPGSHRAGRPPNDETSWHGVEPQAVMVKAGDACLFRGDLWHGAWGNTSEENRYMMQVHYGSPYMGKGYPSIRYESLYSPEVLAQATERQKHLMR